MHNKGGVILGIVVIIFGFILFGTLLTAVDSWGYTSAQTIRALDTGVSTSGNITLGYELYQANLDNIDSIESSLAADDPAPSAYDEDDQKLTVGGLAQSESRTLTVEYKSPRDDSYIGTLTPILPFFVLVLFLAGGGALIYTSVRR